MRATPGLAGYDAHSVRQCSVRLQVLYALHKTINVGGKVVMGIGAIAALCRIDHINRQLASDLFSDEIRQKLEREKSQALSELFVDISDEVGDVMALDPRNFADSLNRLKSFRIGDAASLRRLKTCLPATGGTLRVRNPGYHAGKFLSTGLRGLGSMAGPFLAAAGAFFATSFAAG